MKSISVKELRETISDDSKEHILVDVREPFEHKSEAIPGAENIPADNLNDVVDRLKDVGTVYVHCRTGGRSSRACERLAKEGVNVINVEGGIEEWKGAGFDIEKRGKAIPMFRQVLLTAGLLVLSGMALGYFINELWYLLSVFVGAGLTFAGATGWCGMSEVLKLMPWNKG